MWNVEFCKKLKCEYRIIVANIKKIKSMAKGKKNKKNISSGISKTQSRLRSSHLFYACKHKNKDGNLNRKTG